MSASTWRKRYELEANQRFSIMIKYENVEQQLEAEREKSAVLLFRVQVLEELLTGAGVCTVFHCDTAYKRTKNIYMYTFFSPNM